MWNLLSVTLISVRFFRRCIYDTCLRLFSQALHPLLEDGCEGDEKPEAYMKCAFVGISNWALDPAKMNRGIFVQRRTPANDELEQIARSDVTPSRSLLFEYLGL